MNEKQKIRVKAVCLIVHDNKVLAMDGRTLVATGERPIQPGPFYRLLGGSLNFYEKADEGIRREIREELNTELHNLALLQVIENLYEYAGEKNHEIMFVFKGDVVRTELHAQNPIHVDDEGYSFDAIWVPKEKFLNDDMRRAPDLEYQTYLS